jgi:hypothetical protein
MKVLHAVLKPSPEATTTAILKATTSLTQGQQQQQQQQHQQQQQQQQHQPKQRSAQAYRGAAVKQRACSRRSPAAGQHDHQQNSEYRSSVSSKMNRAMHAEQACRHKNRIGVSILPSCCWNERAVKGLAPACHMHVHVRRRFTLTYSTLGTPATMAQTCLLPAALLPPLQPTSSAPSFAPTRQQRGSHTSTGNSVWDSRCRDSIGGLRQTTAHHKPTRQQQQLGYIILPNMSSDSPAGNPATSSTPAPLPRPYHLPQPRP